MRIYEFQDFSDCCETETTLTGASVDLALRSYLRSKLRDLDEGDSLPELLFSKVTEICDAVLYRDGDFSYAEKIIRNLYAEINNCSLLENQEYFRLSFSFDTQWLVRDSNSLSVETQVTCDSVGEAVSHMFGLLESHAKVKPNETAAIAYLHLSAITLCVDQYLDFSKAISLNRDF